jgi:exosortase
MPPEGQEPRTKREERVVVNSLLGCAVLLVPLYVIQQANPIWRAASWALAFCLVSLSLGILFLVGGPRACRVFSGPILFLLVAVPWPTALEQAVVTFLTDLNTRLTVESLVFVGIPGMQRGNAIQLATGVVGIDEACSGIRSLQANLLLALFVGEYVRFSPGRRLTLVALGFIFAIGFNYARTLLLTLVAAREGIEAMNRWHDSAGVMVLLGCFTALAAASIALNKRENSRPEVGSNSPHSPSPYLRRMLIGLTVWGLLTPVISEVWFRVHESKGAANPVWTVPWPPESFAVLEAAPISERARNQLAFDEGGSVRWKDSDGPLWQVFYFRWLPARNLFRRVKVQFAKSHRPEICLPATGHVLKEQGPVTIKIHEVAIPFRFYRFEDRGYPLHVYLNVRDQSAAVESFGNMRSDSAERLLAAWHGNRATGQQTLQFAVWGIDDEEESRRRLEQVIAKLVKEPS